MRRQTAGWGLTLILVCVTALGMTQARSPEQAEKAVVLHAEQYPSLQAALDAVPAAGGMVVLPAGIIELQEPLVIRTERTRLTGAGSASHLVNKNEQGQPAIHIRSDDYEQKKGRLWNVQLDNFMISGNPKSGTGILAQGIQEIFCTEFRFITMGNMEYFWITATRIRGLPIV